VRPLELLEFPAWYCRRVAQRPEDYEKFRLIPAPLPARCGTFHLHGGFRIARLQGALSRKNIFRVGGALLDQNLAEAFAADFPADEVPVRDLSE